MEKFEDISTLIRDHLPPGCKIHKQTIQPLDNGGQYFSSIVQEAKYFIENKDGNIFKLDLIIKQMPTGEKQVEVNSELGFKKEVAFYQVAIPEYENIQTEHTLEAQNIFPNLMCTSGDVIILNDLRPLNYVACMECLDKAHTSLVLQELAKFHATGVALKLSRPDIFKTKLAEVVTPALQNAGNINRQEMNRNLRLEMSQLVKSIEGIESSAEQMDSTLSSIDEQGLPTPSEPFATLLHNDLWRGNILFKYSMDNKVIALKFFDFQTSIYNSPARDLVYFLFTSVEIDVLNEFEALIHFYHSVFVKYISELGCNPLELTFEKLMLEVNRYGPTKLKHIILLLRKICNAREDSQSSFKDHLKRLVMLFRDRGWL